MDPIAPVRGRNHVRMMPNEPENIPGDSELILPLAAHKRRVPRPQKLAENFGHSFPGIRGNPREGPVDIGPGGKPDSPDFIAAPSEVEFDFGNETHKGEGVEVADTKEGRLYVFELTSRGYRLP